MKYKESTYVLLKIVPKKELQIFATFQMKFVFLSMDCGRYILRKAEWIVFTSLRLAFYSNAFQCFSDAVGRFFNAVLQTLIQVSRRYMRNGSEMHQIFILHETLSKCRCSDNLTH